MTFGAGAIGGVISARLHETGHDVVLVARGRHYEVLAPRGLELRSCGALTADGRTNTLARLGCRVRGS